MPISDTRMTARIGDQAECVLANDGAADMDPRVAPRRAAERVNEDQRPSEQVGMLSSIASGAAASAPLNARLLDRREQGPQGRAESAPWLEVRTRVG